MLKLDKNTLEYFRQKNVNKIKIFFYDAGCSGTKVNITDDFEIDENLVEVSSSSVVKLFVEKKDFSKFENCSITRTITADHTGKEKIRYIYASDEVKGRCWCWSSFSFGEKKKNKINLNNLKDLKKSFSKD